MITEIQIGNVRLFDGPDEWRIPLSPLSVFCGTNSSGKSTILKSLLLLCQTVSVDDVGQEGGRIRFSGAMIDLGSYRSFVSHNEIKSDMLIGVTIRNLIENGYLQELDQARAQGSTINPAFSDGQQPYTLNAKFQCGVSLPESFDDGSDIDSVPAVNEGTSGQAFVRQATFDFQSDSGVTLSWKLIWNPSNREYDILIPLDYFGMMRGFDTMQVPKGEVEGFVRIETFLRGLIPTGLWARPKTKKGTDTDAPSQSAYFPLPPLIRNCCESLRKELMRVHYLGPTTFTC